MPWTAEIATMSEEMAVKPGRAVFLSTREIYNGAATFTLPLATSEAQRLQRVT